MTGNSNLTDRLEQLVATGLPGRGGRRVSASSPERLMRRLLRELDTVMLPRVVSVSVDGGGRLAFECANRRLLRLSAPGQSARILNSALDHQDPDLPTSFRKIVETAIAGRTEAMIVHAPFDRAYDPTEAGISIRALSDTLGVDLAPGIPPEAGEIIDTVVSKTQDIAGAWVMLADETSESFGDPELVDALTALADADIAPGMGIDGPSLYPDEPWHLLALRQGDMVCVIATVGPARLLMSIAPDNVGEVARLWRRAVAS